MKTKLGILFVILGLLLVASAAGLFIFNNKEQEQAGEMTKTLMPKLVKEIKERHEGEKKAEGSDINPSMLKLQDKEMTVVDIDGYGYIGFITIPSLEKELPVMADWSYDQLKMSPCRFYGSTYEDNLVIMAHNYYQHFAGLQNLRVGDELSFTDMDGITIKYTVAALDILEPNDVEHMIAGEYDLSLFTCSYGGQSRVTVRCDRSE